MGSITEGHCVPGIPRFRNSAELGGTPPIFAFQVRLKSFNDSTKASNHAGEFQISLHCLIHCQRRTRPRIHTDIIERTHPTEHLIQPLEYSPSRSSARIGLPKAFYIFINASENSGPIGNIMSLKPRLDLLTATQQFFGRNIAFGDLRMVRHVTVPHLREEARFPSIPSSFYSQGRCRSVLLGHLRQALHRRSYS